MFRDFSLQEISENSSGNQNKSHDNKVGSELNTTGEFFNQNDRTLPLEFGEHEIEKEGDDL